MSKMFAPYLESRSFSVPALEFNKPKAVPDEARLDLMSFFGAAGSKHGIAVKESSGELAEVELPIAPFCRALT